MSKSNLVPIILAGGAGTRLWPMSRRAAPKPFVRLLGERTLLERSWERAVALAEPERVLVTVEERLAPLVRRCLPRLPAENLLTEPCVRDTAPAALRAAWHVSRRYPEAVMALIPADQVVADEDAFRRAMDLAQGIARQRNGLVCLGVRPERPSTAFGYLVCDGKAPDAGESGRVARFEEKPSPQRAAALVDGGGSLWNSGIFVWRPEVLLTEAQEHAAELAGALRTLLEGAGADAFFRAAPRISIDHAVMERSGNVWVVGTDMGWDDLGSWEAVARHLPMDAEGNSAIGRSVAVGARDCFAHAVTKPVVLVGVSGLAVVEQEDVILVIDRSESHRLRDLAEILERQGLGELV